jgi:hypothetical protein
MPSPAIPSARVLANRANRVVMNRAALTALQLGMADGLLELGRQIIADAAAHAPRDPEIAAKRGVPMMADTGHVVVYALGKKVGGDEGNTGKPRGMRTPANQVVLGVWFSSPLSHFAELGTIKEIAHPFLTPAFDRHITDAAKFVVPAMGRRVKAVPA